MPIDLVMAPFQLGADLLYFPLLSNIISKMLPLHPLTAPPTLMKSKCNKNENEILTYNSLWFLLCRCLFSSVLVLLSGLGGWEDEPYTRVMECLLNGRLRCDSLIHENVLPWINNQCMRVRVRGISRSWPMERNSQKLSCLWLYK